MGRRKINISRSELLHAIQTAEQTKKFTTRQSLAQFVEQTNWAKSFSPKPITAAVVLLRIKDFGLDAEIATPKGKRGRAKGTVLSAEQKQAMLAGRKKEFVCSNIKEIKAQLSPSRSNLVDRLASGSLKAAIKAQCLVCCQEVTDEIRNCTVTGCPLYSFRPYQK